MSAPTNLNPNNRTANTQQPQPQTQQPSGAQGVSGTPDTMTSAAQQPADTGCFSSMCTMVTNAFNAAWECVRWILNKLTCGMCCASATQQNQGNTNQQGGNAIPQVDLDHCSQINQAFTAAATIGGQTRRNTINGAVDHFVAIADQKAKWKAFSTALEACAATNGTPNSNFYVQVAKAFFGKLSVDMQNTLKGEIYAENGNQASYNNTNHGDQFGDVMVRDHLLSDVVLQAAANLAA